MKRAIPISLAFILLIGTVSVTVNRHFCMGELQSIALFSAAEACHEEAVASCPLHASPKWKGCCNDDQELVKADNDRQLVDVPSLPTGILVLAAQPAPPAPEFVLHLRSRLNKRFENYRPPPRLLDAPRQYQVFRI